MNYFLLIDNFFNDPDHYRNIGIRNIDLFESPNFLDNAWRGFRYELKESSVDFILDTVAEYFCFNVADFSLRTYLHLSTEDTKKSCFPHFEEYKFHVDSSEYAGLVYMTPNSPPKFGTTIIDKDSNKLIEIENIYNRLICYPGSIVHGPTNLFGTNVHDGRLTLTFFIDRKEKK